MWGVFLDSGYFLGLSSYQVFLLQWSVIGGRLSYDRLLFLLGWTGALPLGLKYWNARNTPRIRISAVNVLLLESIAKNSSLLLF